MKRQYVGIDLHRRSTTLYRMAEDGEMLSTERIVSQPFELAQAMKAAGPEPEVVLESHLRLVLGGRCARRPWRPRAPRPRPGQQLGGPTRQERRTRRQGPGRHAPHRAPRRGLDRPA